MIRFLLAGTVVLMTGAAAATDAPEDKLVAFPASVRVDLDATGKPVSVRAPESLPAVVREALEQRVALWGYEPARQAGVPVPATTFVYVGVCARPDGGGIRLGVDYKGHGPRVLSPQNRLMPPAYPVDAARAGARGAFRVNYTVRPDGSTQVISVNVEQGRELRRHRKSFEKSLMSWASGMRYEPEQIGGTPVATQQSVPVIFGFLPSDERSSLQVAAKQECRETAAPAGLVPIALDSPVKVTPQPAG